MSLNKKQKILTALAAIVIVLCGAAFLHLLRYTAQQKTLSMNTTSSQLSESTYKEGLKKREDELCDKIPSDVGGDPPFYLVCPTAFSDSKINPFHSIATHLHRKNKGGKLKPEDLEKLDFTLRDNPAFENGNPSYQIFNPSSPLYLEEGTFPSFKNLQLIMSSESKIVFTIHRHTTQRGKRDTLYAIVTKVKEDFCKSGGKPIEVNDAPPLSPNSEGPIEAEGKFPYINGSQCIHAPPDGLRVLPTKEWYYVTNLYDREQK